MIKMFSTIFTIFFNIFLYIVLPIAMVFIGIDTYKKTKEELNREEDFE